MCKGSNASKVRGLAQRVDPFKDMLQKAPSFSSEAQREAYLGELGETLSMLREEACSAVIADGLGSDFPIVAVSETFLESTSRPQGSVIGASICSVLNNLNFPGFEPGSLSVSKSACHKSKNYCDLARFPGALSGGYSCQVVQLSLTSDAERKGNNRFVLFRLCLKGYPLILGIQSFSDVSDIDDPDDEENAAAFAALEGHVDRLCQRLQQDEKVAGFFAKTTTYLPSSVEPQQELGNMLFTGRNAPSKCLFFNCGRSVLRQEPHTLPRSGVLFTANPLKSMADGSLRYSLRVGAVADWDDQSVSMGFTRSLPTEKPHEHLHLMPYTVAFTIFGPTVQDSAIVTRKAPKSSTPQEKAFPRELKFDDVITVELTQSGMLRRFLNGVLVSTFPTECRPEGAWYAAFEVSFKVASVEMVSDSSVPFLHDADTAAGGISSSVAAEYEKPTPNDASVVEEHCEADWELLVQEEKGKEVILAHKSEDLPTSPRKSQPELRSILRRSEALDVPSPSRRPDRRSYISSPSLPDYSDVNDTILHNTAARNVARLAVAEYVTPTHCRASVNAAELSSCFPRGIFSNAFACLPAR